jgi:ATP phosphoribosyltransferase
MPTNKLRVGVQKKGRISQDSLQLIRDTGIEFTSRQGTLFTEATNFPMEIIFLRDDDIPEYVADGTLDVGVVGHNEIEEKNEQLEIVKYLGFAKCHLSIAVPVNSGVKKVEDLEGLAIATSYPNTLRRFLQARGVRANIQEISGSVEIAPGIGLADAICDIVQTGSTLVVNGLKEIETVFYSEAVLVANPDMCTEKKELLEKFLFRLESYIKAKHVKCIAYHIPDEKYEEAVSITPGIGSPSRSPLQMSGWSLVVAMLAEDKIWDAVDSLKALGASGIFILPVEKVIQ